MINRECCINGCSNKASKTKIIFRKYYNFCKDHGIKDLKTLGVVLLINGMKQEM